MESLKNIFVDESTLKEHIDAQNNKYDEYITHLILLSKKYNVDFSINKKAQILSAAIHRNDKGLAKYLLNDNKNYDLPVIEKTCSILDSRRLYELMNKKTTVIKNNKKLMIHKSIMSNLKKMYEDEHISLTSSKCKFIKKNWIQNIDKNDLEYNIIQFNPDMWKKIIDLLHLKPSDFKLEWFTKYIFEKVYPENSMIAICKSLNKDNINDIVKMYKLPYGYLKTHHKNLLNDNILLTILDYINLNDVIKDWEIIFNKPIFHNKILERMNNERLTIPYGELMKRLISFYEAENINIEISEKLMKIASDELTNFHSYIEQPVVVFGDASSSMDVAIMTSSIITSILCSISNAKLHLFREYDEKIINPPRTVGEVITLGMKCKASGTTAPVTCLLPYLERKEIVKTFIIVTDEEENSDGKYSISPYGVSGFAQKFKLYHETVYPAKLIFISFLDENTKQGKMVSALRSIIPGIDKDIIQFRLSSHRPDLRKLDLLLSKLSINSDYYDEISNNIINQLKELDFDKINICSTIIDEPNYMEIVI